MDKDYKIAITIVCGGCGQHLRPVPVWPTNPAERLFVCSTCLKVYGITIATDLEKG